MCQVKLLTLEKGVSIERQIIVVVVCIVLRGFECLQSLCTITDLVEVCWTYTLGGGTRIRSLCLRLDLHYCISISYCYILFEIAYLQYRIVFVYANLNIVLSYHICVRLQLFIIALCSFNTSLIFILLQHILLRLYLFS